MTDINNSQSCAPPGGRPVITVAGILAGGVGSRMGSALPKQFLEVGGVPIIARTVETFVNTGLFDMIFIAVAEGWTVRASELVEKNVKYDSDAIRFIPGGSDRTGSILNVIDAAGAFALALSKASGRDIDPGEGLLVTHDAARPFVTERMIRESIDAALETGCAGTGIPALDTVFTSSDGRSIEDIPPRNTMFQMQTPQTFRIGLFKKALDSLDERQRAEVTDACGVFRRAGMPVSFAAGSRNNIKITEPIDLAIAERIASEMK